MVRANLRKRTILNPETVKVGSTQSQNAVSDVMEQARDWIKTAIQKSTKEQVEKLIKESMGVLENVNIHEDRKIFVSRFTEAEQKTLDYYANRSVTPLNNFYPYNPNPLAAAQDYPLSSNNPNAIQIENLMNNVQLSECADAFFADGVLRSILSLQVDFVLPDRTKVVVKTDKAWEENKDKLDPKFAEEFKEIDEKKIAEYNVRISRLMEELHLWDNQIKLFVTSILFGRNGLFIEREDDPVYPKYGKPTGFMLLNPLQIKKSRIKNDKTKAFDGFFYDWGVTNRTNEVIPTENLVPFFYDDFNIYKNTYFSGMTRIFSLIGIAHSNQLINTYDLPLATMSQYSNTSYVYVGQPSQILARKFAGKIRAGVNVHDQPMLDVKEARAARQIIDILATRDSNYKAMAMILGIPIFLLFENTANFATAAIAMQAFLNGTCHRLSTFFMDQWEQYFFMPLLAEIAGIELATLLKQYVQRTKAIRPPIDLQTKTDRFTNANSMWDRQIFTTRKQYLEYVQEDELAELAEPLDKLQERLKKEQKLSEIERLQKEGLTPPTSGNGQATEKEDVAESKKGKFTASEAGKKLLNNFAGND